MRDAIANFLPEFLATIFARANVSRAEKDRILLALSDAYHETQTYYASLNEGKARDVDREYGRNFPHGVIHHGQEEYVHGNIHTNTIEGFWSLIKRGIMGTFHKVSRKYLPLYVNEFEFRYNNRMNADIFGAAIKAC